MNNKKLQIWLPLLFSLIMITGMYFGYNLKGEISGRKRNSLQETMDLIKLKYVDSVGIDSLQGRAIEQMMNMLDPHSIYIPASHLEEVNEDLAGNFEGIGVEFNIFNDTVNVLYVIPGGPSDKAGLQIGDKILKVNDSTLIKNVSSDDVKKIVKGPRGSKALLQILRGNKMLTATVTRGTIPVSAVDASYMTNKETGYIKLSKFSDNTYADFMQALENLQKQGLKKLILDLRGNGGGYMNEAVDIADEFLSGNKLIVYTQGVNSPRREYRCKRDGLFENGELVLLVDELTASASEILAGALQDWCRAKIIGRRTFGKGLVQEQFPLSDGSALRLTVARYYTPEGRSIQRSYEKGKKVYMDEIWERYSDGEALYADSNKIKDGKLYRTSCGDSVYGGGGIMPNIFVPIDTSMYPQNVGKLLIDGTFNNCVYNFYLSHKDDLQQYKNISDYMQHFDGEIDIWNEFVRFAEMDSVDIRSVSQKDKTLLGKRLKAYLARFRWRNSGFYEVLNENDDAVKKALDIMTK